MIGTSSFSAQAVIFGFVVVSSPHPVMVGRVVESSAQLPLTMIGGSAGRTVPIPPTTEKARATEPAIAWRLASEAVAVKASGAVHVRAAVDARPAEHENAQSEVPAMRWRRTTTAEAANVHETVPARPFLVRSAPEAVKPD